MKVAACALSLFSIAVAQSDSRLTNPFAAEGEAAGVIGIRQKIPIRCADTKTMRDHLICAELKKRAGHHDAYRYYELAIAIDADEPATELLAGDYFRLYRGAGQKPLFPRAERHLQRAWAKLQRARATPGLARPWDDGLESRLRRSLAALYQRDGIEILALPGQRRAFVGASYRQEQATADFDTTSDIRSWVAQAAYSASRTRLRVPLTLPLTRGLARSLDILAASPRLRWRGGEWPVVDAWLNHRTAERAAVPNYFRPSVFGDVHLNGWGLNAEKPFTIGHRADVLLSGGWRSERRRGSVEFQARDTEEIHQGELQASVSTYLGPDRLNVSGVWVKQQIDTRVATVLPRDRRLAGASVSYQAIRLLREGFSKKFEVRGLELGGGVLDDAESYRATTGDVLVTRRDYYASAALRGIKKVDVTIQPTVFTNAVSNDPSQNSRQYRTSLTVRVRVIDEERVGGLPRERLGGLYLGFVNVAFPFQHDRTLSGSPAYENWRVGAEVWTKVFSPKRHGATVLGYVGYHHQRLIHLDRTLGLWRGGLMAGF